MTKTSGLGAFATVDEFVLSNDFQQFQVSCPVGQHIATGIDKTAMERLNGIRDGMVGSTVFFNPATGRAHEVLSPLTTSDRLVMIGHRSTQGSAVACLFGKQIGYDMTRGSDGMVTFAQQNPGNGYGLEWGHVVSEGFTTSTGAEALDGYDDGAGAATDFGLQAYLQVSAFTGTSATITIQDSDDDGSGDAYAAVTGAAFAAVTGVGVQRIETSRTENVKEWLRCSISGTYSNLEFIVVVNRNPVAVSF